MTDFDRVDYPWSWWAERFPELAEWERPTEEEYFKLLYLQVVRQILDKLREEEPWLFEPVNDYHIFYEEWLGLDSILGGVSNNGET
jgi:hypothetical protein